MPRCSYFSDKILNIVSERISNPERHSCHSFWYFMVDTHYKFRLAYKLPAVKDKLIYVQQKGNVADKWYTETDKIKNEEIREKLNKARVYKISE